MQRITSIRTNSSKIGIVYYDDGIIGMRNIPQKLTRDGGLTDRSLYCYQPDKNKIYTVEGKWVVCIDGKNRTTIMGTIRNVKSVAVSYSGKYLYGIDDRHVLFDFMTNKDVLDIHKVSDTLVSAFAISDDGGLLVIGFTHSLEVLLIDIPNAKIIRRIPIKTPVKYMSFDKNADELATLDNAQDIYVCNIKGIILEEAKKLLALGTITEESNINSSFAKNELFEYHLLEMIIGFIDNSNISFSLD